MSKIKTSSKSIQDRGFIYDLYKFILKHIDTNPDWAWAIAIATLAGVIPKGITVISNKRKIRLNVNVLCIGPSGISNKTIPILQITIPIYEHFKLVTDKIMLAPDPAISSIEGLYDWMCKKTIKKIDIEGHKEGLIFSDEFTSILGASTMSYLINVFGTLNKIYDNYVPLRITKSSGKEYPAIVNFSFITSTTPAFYTHKNMGRDFFVMGYGNRVIYVVDDPNKRPHVPLTADEAYLYPFEHREDTQNTIEEFARRLAEFNELPEQILEWDDPSARIMTKYRNTKEKLAKELHKKDPDDLNYSYVNRLPAKVMKLTGLHCISYSEKWIQKNVKKDRSDPIPFITEPNVVWAIERVDTYHRHFKRLLNEWTLAENTDGGTAGSAVDIRKVLAQINLLTDTGTVATRTSIRHGLKWTKAIHTDTLRECLEWLVQAKLIDQIRKGNAFIYKPK